MILRPASPRAPPPPSTSSSCTLTPTSQSIRWRIRPLLTLLLIHLFFLYTSAQDSSPRLARKDKDGPSISTYKFANAPAATPSYFEDSDTILILDSTGTVLRSTDAGKEFQPLADVPESMAFDVLLHPYESSTAYVWGRSMTHYVTHDRGETWRSFDLEGVPIAGRQPFSFHFGDPDKVIINVCRDPFLCDETAFYTLDDFKSPVRLLRQDTRGCVFARSTPEWGMNYVPPTEGQGSDTGTDSDDRVVCVVAGRYVEFPFGSNRDNRLVVSEDFFENEDEPILESGRTVQGIVNIAVVKGFLVAAASAKGTDELALFVTDDARQWHRAVFPKDHRLEEDAYTILESTNYSIQVDVMTTPSPLNAMGVLFSSNSNGTYFTRNIEHMNRNFRGMVDFEKISGIQGIILVNVVDNWEDIAKNPLKDKKVKSKITFDDGRTFEGLTSDKDEIHLHSVSDMSNMGRVFSSPAPGLVMGVGNTGKHLKPYDDGDLYVSDDAGLSWSKALKGAHKYEFGDRGAVLVAVHDEGPTDEIRFSIDHGKNWKKADLGQKVKAKILTTTPDSTSLKFFMMATVGDGLSDMDHYGFTIDFADYHKAGKCKGGDFEKWYARVDDKGEPTCLMGHKQWYRRRKADAECFVDYDFQDPVPEYEQCACSKQDFECDYNFVPSEDGKDCVPSGALDAPEGVCQDDEGSFQGSSGFRLIPGNDCDRDAKGAVDLDKDVERPCRGSFKPPASGKIIAAINKFDGELAEYHYPERTDKSSGDDETVMFRTKEGQTFRSKDAGKAWEPIFKDEKITSIWPHTTMKDVVFFLTDGKTVHYTYNRGETFDKFKAPELPAEDPSVSTMGFHPRYKDWIIWTGGVNCNSGKGECHNVAFFSENRGATWDHRLRFVKKCEFIGESASAKDDEQKLIYCEQHRDERLDQPLQLKWSDNWFADDHEVFGDIIDFATMSEFIVVAARQEDDADSLSCHTSIDGKHFAHAQFPPTFDVPTQKAYTVLDSKNHAVFLHVTVNSMENSEYGSIIKSNSNGTSYVMSLPKVNRNRAGYVDFEKMHSLEGVILANVVKNAEDADANKPKKLKSMISHNDGSQWAPIPAPAKDAEGASYGCDVSKPEKCSLHLHSYTERRDKRNTYSSETAIGLMMGVGNVGEELLAKSESDTFMSRDGGIEWMAVKKGNFIWKYGDQGSLVVIVEEDVPTDTVFYSLNEGLEWLEYRFAEEKYRVTSLSTGESGKARNFVLWANEEGEDKLAAINIDFSGLTDQLCKLDENKPEAGDYYLWEPRHPTQQDNCLFGHVAQYHRKRLESECYNGLDIDRLHFIARNCPCTREDFECDYNYELANDGTCQLVAGLQPADHSQQCIDNPELTSYFTPTGYRRTPLDTCEGGRELEYTSKQLPCPGKEEEFDEEQRSKGLSGFWFFVLVFLLPITIAGGVGWWVYTKWDGKFGRIRLGDGTLGGPNTSSGAVFDAEQPWIKYPIMGIAGLVAVGRALPLVAATAYRGVLGLFGRGAKYSRVGTYTSRGDFARGAGRYAVVDPDEDELLAEEEEDGDDLNVDQGV